MLRFLIVVLLLANGLYYAWTQGHLAVFGLAPVTQTEPERVAAQIKPDAIRLLSSNEVGRIETVAAAPAAKPAECLQSPLLTERVATAVRSAALALPPDSWVMEQVQEDARWIVYMGKYNDPEVLAKKQSELRQLGVTFDTPAAANLAPGISLGGHASQIEATRALASLNARGVRTAKVVQEAAAVQGQVLRLGVVDDALRGQLEPVKAALGAAALRACKI
jgi:hypothetical protein